MRGVSGAPIGGRAARAGAHASDDEADRFRIPACLPACLISIDTEGDDIWSRPREVTTRNARTLPRFQELCERFGFRPTYLVNHEMALDEVFREFGRDGLARDVAEIGMHLHAWDTPPVEPLGPRDWYDQPYAIEFPPGLIARKAELMTRLLEDTFGQAPTSHRAGRWGFDESYAGTLLRLGYEVDHLRNDHITFVEDTDSCAILV